MYCNSFCLNVPIYCYNLFLGILLGRTFSCIDEQIPKCDFILSYKYSSYLTEWLVTYICNHIECYLTPEMTQIKSAISLTVLIT